MKRSNKAFWLYIILVLVSYGPEILNFDTYSVNERHRIAVEIALLMIMVISYFILKELEEND